jgi:creatinine amidohydrolase
LLIRDSLGYALPVVKVSVSMRYGDLTYEEIRDRAHQGWLAIVPTGCTEQQGPHLTVDYDTWFVEQVTAAASEKAKRDFGVLSLVLPATPFGPTPEHRNYGSGYIDVPQELHANLVEAILASLAQQGFTRMVVWRGCGQHDLAGVVERFNRINVNRAHAFLPELPYGEIMRRTAPDVVCGHADAFATSIALHLRPQAVRVEKIPAPMNDPIDWDDPNLDFARYSSSGVIGDPSQSSPDLGATLWASVVEEVALILRSCSIEDV